jgi:hypothetical protein
MANELLGTNNYKLTLRLHIHTYHSRFISEGVAETFQIFLRDITSFKNDLAIRNTTDCSSTIAVWSQAISGVSVDNPQFAFYDIHWRKGVVLFFVLSTTLHSFIIIIISLLMSPLLGHRPSLWITHKENRPYPTTRAQYGLMGGNDCKCSWDQRLNVTSKARRSSR